MTPLGLTAAYLHTGMENIPICCGVAQDVSELLHAHPSAGRILENIRLERLHHSDLRKIFTAVSEKLNLAIQQEALIRIG